jgi:hypothetical protein
MYSTVCKLYYLLASPPPGSAYYYLSNWSSKAMHRYTAESHVDRDRRTRRLDALLTHIAHTSVKAVLSYQNTALCLTNLSVFLSVCLFTRQTQSHSVFRNGQKGIGQQRKYV